MTHDDDDRYDHDHDRHTCSWQTCAKKSEGLGRVGFYFSKFEAPLDYCPLISLLTHSLKIIYSGDPEAYRGLHFCQASSPHNVPSLLKTCLTLTPFASFFCNHCFRAGKTSSFQSLQN